MSSENGWEIVSFGSIMAQKTRNGIHKSKLFQGHGIPVIKMGEVYSNPYIDDLERDLLDLSEKEQKTLLVEPDDLLFCRTSLVFEGVGKCAMVRSLRSPSTFASNLIRVRLNRDLALPRYILYLFNSPIGQYLRTSIARGTSVTTITGPDLSSLQIPLPTLSEQHRIVDVLGALDDKIELNIKLNLTIEKMTQILFKSWFIDFDGHKDLLDSKLGPIPRGWRAGSLGEICNIHRENIDPTNLDPDTPYIGLANMPRGSISLRDWSYAGEATSNKAKFEKLDLLFGKLRPYFKKVGIAPFDGICSSDILVIRPIETVWWSLALGVLTYDRFIDFTTAVSTGTRMPRVNWKNMKGYGVAIPPSEVAQQYHQTIQAMVSKIVLQNQQSHSLSLIRDTLLPKLISGEIRVPEIEISSEPML